MRYRVIDTHFNSTLCKHNGRSCVTEMEPFCLGIGFRIASAHSSVIFPVVRKSAICSVILGTSAPGRAIRISAVTLSRQGADPGFIFSNAMSTSSCESGLRSRVAAPFSCGRRGSERRNWAHSSTVCSPLAITPDQNCFSSSAICVGSVNVRPALLRSAVSFRLLCSSLVSRAISIRRCCLLCGSSGTVC